MQRLSSPAPLAPLSSSASSNTFPVTASGFPAPTFSTPGPLPTGVTLSSAGSLSGTPTAAGVFTFTITATNGISPDATQSFTLTVVTQSSYTQPFNSGHGWTFTQVGSCTGVSCTNTTNVNDSTHCGPPGVGTLCVSAANVAGAAVGNSVTYIHSPISPAAGALTWQSLGVPANATVTFVAGTWYDYNVSGGITGCSSARAGLEIFDAANQNALSLNPIVGLQTVTTDAGVTHPLFGAQNITSNASSSSGITIHFDLDTAGNAIVGSCTLYGDNVNLVINYTLAHGKRGQVIIGMNAQPDGTLGKSWAYNVEYLNDTAKPAKLVRCQVRAEGPPHEPVASTLEGEGRKVTKIDPETN